MAFDKNAFAAAFLNQLTAGMEERKEKAEEYEIVAENTPPSITAGTIFLVCNLLEIKDASIKIDRSWDC